MKQHRHSKPPIPERSSTSARIEWTFRALKDAERLPTRDRMRVLDAFDALASTGRGDVVRLQAVTPPEFRLRVGDWRVRYRSESDPSGHVLTVLRVLNRRDAYR